GYISPEPRAEFFQYMDAANIDLKGFNADFYQKLCAGELDVVLETLIYLKQSTRVHVEITNLIIPGANDSEKELRAMCEWILTELGPDVPLHFTAFHPDFKMTDIASTPPGTLRRARNIALETGIHHCYTGNVHSFADQSTYCHACKELLIGRDWYQLSEYHLDEQGRCSYCGTVCPGVFESAPGRQGPHRVPVRLQAAF
ncbi:MAG: AmmeMemoRadiSam system radical SAM enzyme, partial [Leptospiraceae bacterium]|nr:AmmeMemoRadiSam system radical SAM enzyme [Leptospiraceae bacterium]